MSNEIVTPETQEDPMKWVISNILSIIFLLQEKFGPQAVEQIVAVASTIENEMDSDLDEEAPADSE